MSLIKSFLASFLIMFLFLNLSNATSAAPQEISAEGEYRLGDRDTRENAKMAALADAKRKIIEQVGVYIESYSEINKFKLTQDQIRTAANAMIKVKSEKVEFIENGTLCRAFVTAIADVDNIGKFLINSENTENNNFNDSVKDKKLKQPGIEEYNGHYYKVFNEGMTWTQAKKRCEEMGGHLVTINSSQEQNIVESLLRNGNKNVYWIGGYRQNNGNWYWVDNTEFYYSKWAQGEPNGDGKAIQIYRVKNPYANYNTFGEWNDISSEGNGIYNEDFFYIKNYGFICEWDSYSSIK